MRVIEFIFPLSVLLTGLLAGIHFANLIGYLPALSQVEAEHIIPFWKKVDEYFSRRMPLFGITLMICLLLTILLVHKDTGNAYFWLLLSGFVLIITDMAITMKINTPANEIIRAWQGGPIPENFESLRSTVLAAFYGRAVASILSFILVVLAYIFWQSKVYR